MFNVGSVGQPRDGDPRACYVVLENGSPTPTETDAEDAGESAASAPPIKLTYRRVDYPFDETAAKIYDIPRSR